jgi:hypothetical protein
VAGDSTIDRFELPSTGDLAALGSLRADLLGRLAEGRGVHLDARHVHEPSTALVQLVESAAVSFGARELGFGLVEPSDALCSAYEDLGLFGALMSRIAVAE